MFINTWGEIFTVSLQNLWLGFIDFVPKLVGVIIIFIVGWLFASIVGKVVSQLIDAIKLDSLLASAGVDGIVSKAGYKLNTGKFLGWLVKWFIIIVFLMASFDVLGLTQVNTFLNDTVLSYLPQVIIALLILVLATVIADAVGKVVVGATKVVGVHSANMLGVVARYAVWIFAIVIALDKLGVFQYFGQILFGGLIVMLALAFGLAFGLGGKDAAARALERFSAQAKGMDHHN